MFHLYICVFLLIIATQGFIALYTGSLSDADKAGVHDDVSL